MTAATRDQVFSFVLKDRIYEDILRKFLSDKKERDEFRQHLWLQICLIPEKKIILSWNQKWFQYLYVSIIKNQIQSSDSSWHLKYRKMIAIDSSTEIENINDENEIDLKEEKEFKLKCIEEGLKNLESNPNFFIQAELFKLYFQKNMTYRAIAKKTKIPLISVHSYVQTAIVMIRGYVKKKYGFDFYH